MRVIYNAEQVRLQLKARAKEAGSQRKLAKKIGVSITFLNAVVLGRKEPAGKVLKFLKLERQVVYVSPDEPLLTGPSPFDLDAGEGLPGLSVR